MLKNFLKPVQCVALGAVVLAPLTLALCQQPLVDSVARRCAAAEGARLAAAVSAPGAPLAAVAPKFSCLQVSDASGRVVAGGPGDRCAHIAPGGREWGLLAKGQVLALNDVPLQGEAAATPAQRNEWTVLVPLFASGRLERVVELTVDESPLVHGLRQVISWGALAATLLSGLAFALMLPALARAARTASEQGARAGSLAQAAGAAQTSSDRKTLFLAKASHELRTPMNGIVGVAEMLLQSGGLNDEQRKYVQVMLDASAAMTTALDSFTELVGIEGGVAELRREQFRLATLVRSVVLPFQVLAGKGGVELKLVVASELPDTVIGDQHKLRQVLSTLLANALKHTVKGRITLRVGVEAREDGPFYCFEVADTGSGISEEQLPHIFADLSAQDSGFRSWQSGGGLGLNIAHQLVQLMGGELGVESRLNQGSRFFFTVALATPEYLPEAEEKARRPQPRRFTRHKVLVVEDNLINQRVERAMLEKLGQDVIVVGDGAQALRFLRKELVDIIFLDIQMPVVDGYAVIKHIRSGEGLRVHHSVPVIAMTAHASAGDREKCLAAGMNGYLSKPISAAALREALSSVLSD